ncbi:MAG: furin, partial [Cyanobacteria bacterium P01_E01_bin.34]
DVLFGQQGRDRFRFNSFFDGRDTIRDFNGNQDRIEIALTGFTSGSRPGAFTGFNSGLRLGTIAANQFTFGSATQSTHRFIFNNDTLFFDADGSGVLPAVQLAKVFGNVVSRTNIVVV